MSNFFMKGVKRRDLLAAGGASLVGYEEEPLQTVIDDAKPMQSYAEIRAYRGRATGIRITAAGVAGYFQRDTTDATSADNGGTVILDASGRRWRRLFTGLVNVRWFGAKGDFNGSTGTDDSAAFSVALKFSWASQRPLHVPSGFYKLSSWSGLNLSYLNMVGDGYETTKIITTINTSTNILFATMTGGMVSLSGIHFENFFRVINSDATLSSVFIEKCRGKNNRSYFMSSASYSYGYTSSIIGSVHIIDNVIEDCLGFCVVAKVDQVIVSRNRMTNVKVNQALWGATGHDANVFGIAIGDGSNKASSIGNYNVRGIVVADNNIKTVYNSLAPPALNTTNAIMVSGLYAQITGNVVDGMTAADPGNCEAIYTKAIDSLIANNIINDGTMQSACIAVKGDSYASLSRNVVVINNIIKGTVNTCVSGIVSFESDSVTISRNSIQNMWGDSIKVFGSPSKLDVSSNNIHQVKGLTAIALRCGDIVNSKVDGNLISGFDEPGAIGKRLKVIWCTARGKVLETISVASGGASYTSEPTVTFTNPLSGTYANVEVSISGGAVVGVHLIGTDYTFDMTTPVTATLSGGGGTGASLTCTVSQGAVRNLSITNNKINISPKASGVTEAAAINVQSLTDANSAWSGIIVRGNSINCDAATTYAVSPYIAGLWIDPPANRVIDDVYVGDHFLSGPSISATVDRVTPIVVKVAGGPSYKKPYEAGERFLLFNTHNIVLNGVPRRILTNCQISEGKATLVIPALRFGAVGSYEIGRIPFACQIHKAVLFNSGTIASATNASKISFAANTAGNQSLLNETLATTAGFPANAYTDMKPAFTAASQIHTSGGATSTPIYMDVTVEAFSAVVFVMTLYLEAMP